MKGNIVGLDRAMYNLGQDSLLREIAQDYRYDPHRRFENVGITKPQTEKQEALIKKLARDRMSDYILLACLFHGLYGLDPWDWTCADAMFVISTLIGIPARSPESDPSQFDSYAEYLQGSHWRDEVRPAALKRAADKCQLCGAQDISLHVHHNSYERLGNELPTDLVVLCENCHARFHGIAK